MCARRSGGLRPLVGVTFGAVAHFALIGGVLASVTETAGRAAAFGLAAVTGFAAGFSERFATDIVKHVGRCVAATALELPGLHFPLVLEDVWMVEQATVVMAELTGSVKRDGQGPRL
jgi:hypothetical protein